MKLTTKQLKQMIRESLEQVDYDNPRASFGANDQENLEFQQSQMSFDEKGQMVPALYNAIVDKLSEYGREIPRLQSIEIQKMMTRIAELSQSK